MIRPLLLLTLLLGVGFAVEVTGALAPEAVPPPSGSQPRPGVARAPGTVVAAQPNGRWLSVVLGRPLFAPDRRPAAGAAIASAGIPRLSGLLVSDTEATAIFQPERDGKPVAVHTGGTVNGWRVVQVLADRVDLQKAATRLVVRPSFNDLASGAKEAEPAEPRSRWEVAAKTGILRARWSNPQLQP